MRFQISAEAEEQLDELEQSDADTFAVVMHDLELLDQLGVFGFDVGNSVGSWVHIIGPTGRIGYWVVPETDDVWLIDSIAVH